MGWGLGFNAGVKALKRSVHINAGTAQRHRALPANILGTAHAGRQGLVVELRQPLDQAGLHFDGARFAFPPSDNLIGMAVQPAIWPSVGDL